MTLHVFIPSRVLGPLKFTENNEVLLKPRSGAYEAITAHALNDSRADHDMPSTVQMLLHTGARGLTSEMRIGLPELGYVYYDKGWAEAGRASERVNANVILAWLETGGVEVSEPSVEKEAEDLVRLVEAIASGASALDAGMQLACFRGETMVALRRARLLALNRVAYIEIVGWCVVWLIGVVYLGRVRTGGTVHARRG